MTATVRGISAEGGRGGSINTDLVRTYTVTYLVYTDDRDDGPQQVMNAFGVPRIGDQYYPGNDLDGSAIVTDVRPNQVSGSPWEWEVQVDYSTDSDEPEEEENPLLHPPDISWGFQDRRILIPGRYNSASSPNPSKDLELGITNPAGELFDPQPEMDISEPILTVKRNVATIDVGEFMAIANCVNSDSFYGADPRQLRLKPPTAQNAYDREIGQYWQVTYQLVYKYDTWDVQILNQGTFYLDGSSKPQPFKDNEGHRRVGLLTTTGAAINSSDTDQIGRYFSGGDDPTFTRLRVYREINFSSLGII